MAMMPVMAGNQNRQRDQHHGRNQAAAPPFIFVLERVLEVLDPAFQPAQRLVIGIGGID
jgi:hypothetical protein